MTTRQRIALWTASAVAGVSGLTYAAMKYLLPRTDPFSAYGHPLQPHALKAHVLAVPVLLFVVGWLYGAHAQHRLKGGDTRGRASGRGILALTFVLALSGVLVQAFADASWRPAAAWIHGIIGTAFVAALAGHALVGRRGRVAAERPADGARAGAARTPRRPAYLRPIAFPREASSGPSLPALEAARACGGCPGCGSALGTRLPGPSQSGRSGTLPRAYRD